MPVYGEYETVAEVGRGASTCVYRARPADGGWDLGFDDLGTDAIFALKTFRVRNAEDAGGLEASRFLERVRAQKRVCVSGAQNWAPIIETGKAGPDAFYVAPYYPRTAAKIAQSTQAISSDSLYGIVTGTLKGLLELRNNQGRPHGNLKATNILIKGEGKIDPADIQLTDPAREEDATIAGEVEDLFNLGEIIHELVTGSKFAGHTWPVKPSREWSQLGKKANQWLALCNHLLSPRAAENWLRVDDVFEEIAPLKPSPKRLRSRKLWVAAAACAVVGVLCVGEYFRYASQWRELCADYARGIGALNLQLAQNTPKEIAADAYINEHVVRLLAEARDNNLDLDPRAIARTDQPLAELADHPPINPSVIWKTEKAWRLMHNVQRSLSEQEWKDLSDLASRRADYEKHGWQRLVQYSTGLADQARQPRQGDWTGGIAAAIEGHARLVRLDNARAAARTRMEHLAVRSQATPVVQDQIIEFQGTLRACAQADILLPSALAADKLTQQLQEIEQASARFDEEITLLAEAAKQQRAYEVRGWSTPARWLATLIDRAHPDADLVRLGIDLAAAQKTWEQIETQWTQIDQRRRLFDTSGDRILSTYGEFVTQAQLGQQTDLAALARRIAEINDDPAWTAAAKIVASPQWAKLDLVEFAQKSDAHRGFTGRTVATPQILRLWLSEIENYGPLLSISNGSNDTPKLASAAIKPDEIKRPIETVPQPATMAVITPTTLPAVASAHKTATTIASINPTTLPAVGVAVAPKTATAIASINPATLPTVVQAATKPVPDPVLVQREKDIAAFITESREVALGAKTPQLKEFWRTRNDELASRVEKDHALYSPALKSQRDALRKRLLQLDGAYLSLGAPPVLKAGAAPWSAPLIKALQAANSQRPDVLKEILPLAGSNDERFDTVLARLVENDQQWRALAGRLVADASRLDELLAGGFTPADKTASVAVALSSVRSADLYKIATVRQALEQLIKPIDAVESESAPATLRVLAAFVDWPLGVRLMAWGKIGDAATTESLTSDLKLSSALLSGVQKNLTDKSRVSAIKNQIEGDLRRRWESLLEHAARDQDIEAAIAFRDQIPGIDPQKLSARSRFNLALHDFRQAVAAAHGEDVEKQIATPAQKLKAILASLDSADAKNPQLVALASEIDRAGHSAAVDFSHLGPMSEAARALTPKVVWNATAEDSGDKVTYRANLPTDAGMEEVSLIFRRVHPSASQSSWVCTTETSLGVFCDLITASGKWADTRSGKLLFEYDPMRGDPRVGPRTWEWPRYGRSGDITRTQVWLSREFIRDGLDHYPFEIRGEYNLNGTQIGSPITQKRDPDLNPSRLQPMQYVSIKAAQLAATAAGCRIPTIGEWQAAWQSVEQRVTGNLRDRTWRLELEHMSKPAFGRARPDAGMFVPAGEKPSDKVYTRTDSSEFDDGTLWFKPVPADAAAFVDLIGNVAEFVSDDSGKTYVIGGSSMSPPGRPLDRPFALAADQGNSGFSDVGFRMAFSGPASGIEKLKESVAGNWYLPGR